MPSFRGVIGVGQRQDVKHRQPLCHRSDFSDSSILESDKQHVRFSSTNRALKFCGAERSPVARVSKTK